MDVQIKCDLRPLKYEQNGTADEIVVALILNFQNSCQSLSLLSLFWTCRNEVSKPDT